MRRDVSERVAGHVAVAAREVHREYGVDLADLQGEGYLWAVSNPKKVREYEADEDARQGDRMIYSAIRNRLRYYSQREVSRAYGYDNRADQFVHYSAAQLREELLPCLFDKDLWANPPVKDRAETKSTADPAHGNTWLAMLADCADAYRRLPVEERVIVEMRWRDDLPQKAIARTLDVSETTVSERLDRAVHRMVWHLGGERPVFERDELPVGSRRAMSNSHAQAVTRAVYDGE